ncbi:MAG: serine hydrolase [Anaerolineales bacterium]
MKIRNSSFLLRWVSLLFLLTAVILTASQLVGYSRLRSNYPPGMTIGGVPVGGLDPNTAAQRLLQVYATPVEIRYGEAVIHLDPALVGFQADIEAMLAAADLQRTGSSFWGGFWDYLWNQSPPGNEIPLIATYSEERLRQYLLNEISARYDQPPVPAQPIANSPEFTAGSPGTMLDLDRAVVLIENALYSPTGRTVILSSQTIPAGRPSLQTLQLQLQQIVDQNGFDGLIDIYLLDLQTGEELHFAYQAGVNLPVNPDIAFTASSTIKIPVMVSVYRHSNGRLTPQQAALMSEMIQQSNNDATDALIMGIDEVRGPLIVSEDMRALGLENTFLAGYFYPGAYLLYFATTPANQRTDVDTDPDPYNQTTPSDMGMLLADLYQCAEMGGGIAAVFPGQIDQTACREMISYLQQDRIGVLIQAGVPEGTIVAHKHGWVTDAATGVMHNASDAAIVYTPGGNYVLSIYTYHPIQIIWERDNASRTGVSRMFADISRAVYNYFNLTVR